MRARLVVACLMIACGWIGAASAPRAQPHSDVGTPASTLDGEYADSWILVRLKEPLRERETDGSFAVSTGQAGPDAAIAELGVHRIDYALKVSMRNPRRPAALRRQGLDRLYKFHVPPGTDVRQAVQRLSGLPEVDYAVVDRIHRRFGTQVPNDPLWPQQWGYDQPSDADVDGPEAWAITAGEEIDIAVLDTGIDATHPDFAGKIGPRYDFVNDDPNPDDDEGHGTSVSSVAAAATNNAIGLAGSCWNCRIMAVKTLDSTGNGMSSWFIDGVVWATDNGAEVINYSAGNNFHSQAALDAIRYAHNAGVVLTPAVGNEGVVVVFPARYNETIAVSASQQQDRRAAFSSTGREIDHVAPGQSMMAATDGGGYSSVNGTSFSAPLVAGLIGLIKAVRPNVGREEARNLVSFGSQDQVGLATEDTPGWDPFHGWGRVNMHQSLLGAQAVATLRVDGGANTRLFYETANPVATSYDFVRGNLEDLAVGFRGIELGDVVCIENDSADPDTSGNEDTVNPAPGDSFFYLGRFNSDPWPGSFGGSSEGVDRIVLVETLSADLIIDGEISGGDMGESLAAAGDVDNDGFDDVIAGGWAGATPLAGHGSAYLYRGSASGLLPTPAWVLHSDQDRSRLGKSVAGAGDVNNDGFADVIIGEEFWDGASGNNQGRARIYHGSASGLSSVAATTLTAASAPLWFGTSVSGAGDVDDDGFDDVIVAASRYSGGQGQEGRAYLFRGSGLGVSSTPSWTFESNQTQARINAVSGAGDVNNDGFDDVIVGAAAYDAGMTDQGRVWVFLGSSAGLSSTPATTLDGPAAEARFGQAVRSAGDLNEDNRSEVIVVAEQHSNGESWEGGAFIYQGTASGVSTTPLWSFETDQYRALISDANGVGDVDDDGHIDVMVGSRGFHFNRRDEGKAWLFSGTASGPESSSSWSEIGRQIDSQYGMQAVGAGDVNNDGFDDVVVAADEHETTLYNEGRLHVYYGSPSGLAPPDSTFACDLQAP